MSDHISREPIAHLVEASQVAAFDVLGPVTEFLTPLEEGAPCVMRGTIPPGIPIPMHAHDDPETFFMISGNVEALSHSDGGFDWFTMKPGEVFHVPGGAKHAFRNRTQSPGVMLIATTERIGRLFQEVGIRLRPGAMPSGPPSDEMVRHFLEVAARYGYWNASPEENARIGIFLPSS